MKGAGYIVYQIINGLWAIDSRRAAVAGYDIQRILRGEKLHDGSFQKPVAVKMASDGSKTAKNLQNAEAGSVAIITITGELMKYDQECGPVGMLTMSDWIKEASSNPNISAIVLVIDSPGGTVDGTKNMADLIKGVGKPVVAHVDGLMASAALWVGTSAKEVYASNETDQIGSIGVMVSFADMKPVYQQMGVVFHNINSDLSPDKNKMFVDAEAGNYEALKNEMLNPVAEMFISAVQKNRPNVKPEELTGKIFLAKDVVGSLIDGIKTLDDTITRAVELTKKSKTSVYV